MNSFAQDQQQHQFSETWDPSNHARLHFPVLAHPDARPEQAPSQGVRELLYQYEAIQATSTEPLNIFWNDEEENNDVTRRLEEEEEAELQEIRNRLMNDPEMNPPTRGRALCTGTLIVAILLFLTSATVLIVGTVCVFGQCGGGETQPANVVVVDPSPSGTEALIYTLQPTAAPSHIPTTIYNNEYGVGIDENSDNEFQGEGSNIFAQPSTAPPTSTSKPTHQPTMNSDSVSTLLPTSDDGNITLPSAIIIVPNNASATNTINSTESGSSSSDNNNNNNNNNASDTAASTLLVTTLPSSNDTTSHVSETTTSNATFTSSNVTDDSSTNTNTTLIIAPPLNATSQTTTTTTLAKNATNQSSTFLTSSEMVTVMESRWDTITTTTANKLP